jgi:WD40 repeat protein
MTDHPEDRSGQLNEVLAAWYEEVEAGRPVELTVLVARHPDLAEELNSFFEARDSFHRDAGALAAPVGTAVLPPPEPGPSQVSDYEVLDELGTGGMGVVYRARHHTLGRVVALKMIRANLPAEENDARRFRAEAAVVAALEHPHIVPVYDSGEASGRPWFAMRLLEGGSLAHRLMQGPLPPRQAAKLLATVARAVHHAHQRGILHRDLKPGNILLDEQGQPFVSDFGLAKRLDTSTDLTGSHAIIGSARYMAPEQASGQVRQLTTACDVWALGVILYEALTGRVPFPGESALDILQRIRNDPPAPFPSTGGHGDLQTMTLHCLHKESSRRYGSAADLADDLDRWLRGEPIAARATSNTEKLWLWARRNRVLAGLLSLVLLLLLAVAIGASLAAVSFNELAGKERQQAEEAEKARKAADERRSEVEKEREKFRAERDAKEKALIRADGLRLTAHATAALPTDPALALLLAVEGARKAPGLLASDTLLSALNTCQEVRTIPITTGRRVQGLRYSPDGKRLWVTDAEGPIQAIDPSTGKVLVTWPCPGMGSPHHAAFSPDGSYVVIWSETSCETAYRNPFRTVVLTDRVARVYTTAGKFVCILRGHSDRLGSAAFSPDGKRLITASQDRTVRVWDRDTGKELQRLEGTGPFGSASFSPDGKRVLGVAAMRRFMSSIRESRTTPSDRGGKVVEMKHEVDPDQVEEVFLGSTGGPNHICTDCPATLFMVWDLSTGKVIASETQSFLARALEMGSYGPQYGQFSPDGKRVVLGFTDRSGPRTSTAMVWDVSANKPVGYLSNGLSEPPPTFSPNGQDLLFIEGKLARKQPMFWSSGGPPPSHTVKRHDDTITSACFNRDGTCIVTGSADRTVRVWDAQVGDTMVCLRGHTKGVLAVAFHPDSQEVASAGEDDTIRIWRVYPRRPHPQPLVCRFGRVGDVCFSPDGSRVVVGGQDAARLWDARSKRELAVYQPACDVKVDDASRGEISGASWRAELSPDGRKVLVVTDERQVYLGSWDSGKTLPLRPVHIFDAATGKELLRLGSLGSSPTVATFSPDGRSVLVAESGTMSTVLVRGGRTWSSGSQVSRDPVARLYDSTTGKVLWTTPVHPHGVRLAAFSPDGKYVLTSCRQLSPDGWGKQVLTRFWEAASGKEVSRIPLELEPQSASFSPDGKVVILLDSGGLLTAVCPLPTGSGPAPGRAPTHRPSLFSPDSQLYMFISVEPANRTRPGPGVWEVKVWNNQAGKMAALRGHEDRITSATFSPDGRRIATSSEDRTVRLWDVATGKELLRLPVGKKVQKVLFTPGNDALISIDEDGESLQWELDLLAVARRCLPRGFTAEELTRYEIEQK